MVLGQQNGRHFPDDIFKWIFLNENVWISINIPLKFVPRGPINNIPILVHVMAWRRPGDKPLSEPMMVRLPTHICVTRPQWVKTFPIALKFDRHLDSSAAEMPAKFQSDMIIITSNFAASRYHEILGGETSVRLVNKDSGPHCVWPGARGESRKDMGKIDQYRTLCLFLWKPCTGNISILTISWHIIM